MLINIIKFKLNYNLLKNIKLRKYTNALNLNYKFEENYDNYEEIINKENFYNQKCINHIINNNLGSKCFNCNGSGWIYTEDKNNLNLIKNNIKMKYELCLVCNGRGTI